MKQAYLSTRCLSDLSAVTCGYYLCLMLVESLRSYIMYKVKFSDSFLTQLKPYGIMVMCFLSVQLTATCALYTVDDFIDAAVHAQISCLSRPIEDTL